MSAGQGPDGQPGDPGGGDQTDMAAAEYVLGTLPADERTAFERTLADDPASLASVLAWQRRLAPLALTIPEEQPPAGIWEAIARALPGGATVAANDNRLTMLTRQVRRWRLATAGAGLIAAGLGLFAVLGPKLALIPGGEGGQRYVSVVSSGGELPALIVSVDTAAGTAQVRPVNTATPDGRSLELWYVGADKTPKPMGVIGGKANRVTLPEAARSGEGVFAVSIEPPGGSPTGQPTGQVIYTGKLIRD